MGSRSFAGVTGLILAGGRSSRMGSNKALLPFQGGRFIEAIHRQLAVLFGEVILVTNLPEQYSFLPCRTVPDRYEGMGVLAGLQAGLAACRSEYILAVACDMPYLSTPLIKRLCALRHGAEVVIPEGDKGLEPLHALYGKGCLNAMECALRRGDRRIVSFFDEVTVRTLCRDEVAALDPDFESFRNINTPAEYFALREAERLTQITPPMLHRSR